jgi:mRNA-degrading endonuclease RelE of RelBE toxin-antitoxin system
MPTIEEIMRELPPEFQKEVEDFARFLLDKHKQKYGWKLRQNWAGALREVRDQYTSLELQKKALEWRGD